jgi:hypothetical protein
MQAALRLERATVVSLFIFYSAIKPAPALAGMRFNVGEFLVGLGRLLGVPLYCLTATFRDLGAFLRVGLPFDLSLAFPSLRYLVVAIPLYFGILTLAFPITRCLQAFDAFAERVSKRFRPEYVAAMVCVALRVVVRLLPTWLAIRYAFTSQYSDTWGGLGGGNMLWYARGAGVVFKYLAFLPTVPVGWLNERADRAIEAAFGQIVFNAIVVSSLVAIISTLIRRTWGVPSRHEANHSGA